jgi:hypothetical protein
MSRPDGTVSCQGDEEDHDAHPCGDRDCFVWKQMVDIHSKIIDRAGASMSVDNSSEQGHDEGRSEYIARLRSMLIAEREKPKSDDPFGPIDYMASILHTYDHSKSPVGPLRWGMMTEDKRDEYREKAKQTIATWAMEEIMASKIK